MRAVSELDFEIDRLVGELDKIDKAIDGYVDDQGEVKAGALDILADAEDHWLGFRDDFLTRLQKNHEKAGRTQLPSEEKIDALCRAEGELQAGAWKTFRDAQRLVKRLEKRSHRVQDQLSGRQTQVKLANTEAGAPAGGQSRRGLPVHGQGQRAA